MADSYSDRLGLIKMELGSHSNEWGTLANLNFDRMDSAIRGYKKITLAGAETGNIPGGNFRDLRYRLMVSGKSASAVGV